METSENLFGTWDPAGAQAPPLNLDDSEEEIEVEGDGVAFRCHEGPEGYSEEEDEEAEVENEGGSVGATIPRLRRYGNICFPEVPQFDPFEHPAPRHNRIVYLPEDLQNKCSRVNGSGEQNYHLAVGGPSPEELPSPLDFFQLFFTDEEFEILAENTNGYARQKEAGRQGRPWRATCGAELKIFFGLIIYMGVYRSTGIASYWSRNHEFPAHDIIRYMTLVRFEQLKRYFHVAPPRDTPLPSSKWTYKVQPLAYNLQRRFQYHCLPASEVAIDEMMVRFTGRSHHTTMIRGKPIPQGYKMLAVCEHGYTFSFMFTSQSESFSDILDIYQGPQALSPTSKAVFQLATTLPAQRFRFTLYCDNYFSNIPLFTALREYSISACGTVRTNSARYPPQFKLDKKGPPLPWNTISGIISESGCVLALIWQDKTLVRFLTTAHKATPEPENFVYRERRRPHITEANRSLIKEGWGSDPVRRLSLPRFSVDYNDFMGGVDIADQRRSYYSTQLRVCRNWLPIFFWLLDTTIINSHLIARQAIPHPPRSAMYFHHHSYFRTRLAWNLVLSGFQTINPSFARQLQTEINPHARGRHCPGATPLGNTTEARRAGYVGKNYNLPPTRFTPGSHSLQPMEKRSSPYCIFCRYLSKSPARATLFNYGPKGKIRRTSFQCSFCKAPLCREFCFDMYHKYQE